MGRLALPKINNELSERQDGWSLLRLEVLPKGSFDKCESSVNASCMIIQTETVINKERFVMQHVLRYLFPEKIR